RQGEPEDYACTHTPSPRDCESGSDASGDDHLCYRARERNATHLEKVGRGEVQTDAEHQKNDAHVGELRSETGVGHESGREWAECDTGEEIADEGRCAQARGDE